MRLPLGNQGHGPQQGINTFKWLNPTNKKHQTVLFRYTYRRLGNALVNGVKTHEIDARRNDANLAGICAVSILSK